MPVPIIGQEKKPRFKFKKDLTFRLHYLFPGDVFMNNVFRVFNCIKSSRAIHSIVFDLIFLKSIVLGGLELIGNLTRILQTL